MHFSLLVLLDGSRSLGELMGPYNAEDAYEEGRQGDARWEWYTVGGRWRGLIKAKVGGFGSRAAWEFLGGNVPYPSDDSGFDVARVCDIKHLDTLMIHDVLTPDGVWHASEIYYPEGNEDGKHFVTKDGWHESVWDRFVKPHQDCLAMIVDCHC